MELKKEGGYAQLIDEIASGRSVSVFGSPFYNRAYLLAQIPSFVYVCADLMSAKRAYVQLSSTHKNVIFLPPLDDALCCIRQGINNNLERLRAINQIALSTDSIVVTSVVGYAQLYPTKQQIESFSIKIDKNEQIDPQVLCKRLVKAGYKKVVQVDEIGQVAIRGGIIDISPTSCDHAIRLDFFGETVERIRAMDLLSQEGKGELSSVLIAPAAEVFLPENKIDSLKQQLLSAIGSKLDFGAKEKAQEIIQNAIMLVGEGASDPNLNFIKPLLNQCFLDELHGGIVVFDEQKRCVDSFNAHLEEHRSRLAKLIAQGSAFNFGLEQIRPQLKPRGQTIAFDRFLCQNRIFTPEAVVNFSDSELIEYPSNKKLLVEDVKNWIENLYTVTVADVLAAKEIFLEINSPLLKYGSVAAFGAKFDQTKEVFVGTNEVLGKRNPQPEGSRGKKSAFFQPKLNDYVVHPVHGIGLCEGIERMKMGESERDYIIIRYEEGRLYVACESLNMISAYQGEEKPKLNKIGGAEFTRAKERARKAIEEMAFDLSELYAKRQAQDGFRYNPSDYNMTEFEADFPYEETECQLTAIRECMGDLTSGKIMDRLLCGDVGYGKTEVAMRVIYKAVLEGKQAAFVSPTTVLSRQHYNTLNKRMGKFGVKIGSLTRFDSAQQIKQTLKGLSDGSIDVVCGTHRALSKDVVFKDLGILVLDEEQRFGVSDKEKIKLLKTDVNVLSLSATPIPRTLHMSMSGIRDISVLDTAPRGRLEISTYVCPYSDSLVTDAIAREINRSGQAFIVFNRVEFIDSYAASIAKMFPQLRIRVAHGQMEKGRLERAINEFVEGNADILVASTIIENGIDMSNVNTMIVVDSDKLGLGQMYQLRGRIGRGDRQAYAYFTFDGQKSLGESAYKRLDAITSYTGLGSGFKLAMADLEIRGAGNVLGPQQHGHIQKIGYEMYLRLINEVMGELNGQAKNEVKEVKLSIDFAAYIPEEYVSDVQWRLRVYGEISQIETRLQAKEQLKRLKDVYGEPPLTVKNLVLASLIKNLAAKMAAERVSITKSLCEIKFSASNPPPEEVVHRAIKEQFSYSPISHSISFKPKADGNLKLLGFLESFF